MGANNTRSFRSRSSLACALPYYLSSAAPLATDELLATGHPKR